jgi:hypothetical protein
MANSIIPQPHGRVVKWGRGCSKIESAVGSTQPNETPKRFHHAQHPARTRHLPSRPAVHPAPSTPAPQNTQAPLPQSPHRVWVSRSVVGACGAGWVAACGACGSRGASGGSGQSARAGVGACGGIWMGVRGAVSCGAGVWECEGGVWELCGVSLLGVCAGAGVGDVGVVELGAVVACER